MANIRVSLIKVEKKKDKYLVLNEKEVIGIERSLTTNEFETSIQTKLNITRKVLVVSFIYSGEKFVKASGNYYKVERTYDLGQYIELYLASTPLLDEDFIHG